MMNKGKVLVIVSMVVAIALVGSILLTVSAEETAATGLTDEQKTELRGMLEEFREKVILPKLEEYGITIPEGEGKREALRSSLSDLPGEQRLQLMKELRELRQEFRENTLKPWLESQGINIPEKGPFLRRPLRRFRCSRLLRTLI